MHYLCRLSDAPLIIQVRFLSRVMPVIICFQSKSLILIKNTSMARAASLDKKIAAYLTRLTTRQKRTLLTVAKTFAEEQPDDERWEGRNDE